MNTNKGFRTNEDKKSNLIAAVKIARKSGLSVVPPRNDGTKCPFPSQLKSWQTTQPTTDELNGWYKQGLTGVGYVCGAASGNLEVLDFEGEDIYTDFSFDAFALGHEKLLKRIEKGYSEQSPNGTHLYYRCSEIGDTATLAGRPKLPDEMKHAHDSTQPLIVIHGEGGYVIAAPSYGDVNPAGEYKFLKGGPDTIVTISPKERNSLHNMARGLDVPPVAGTIVAPDPVAPESNGTGTAWDVIDHGADSAPDEYSVAQHIGDHSPAPKDLAPKVNAGKVSEPVVCMDDLTWGHPWLFGKFNVPELPASLLPCVYGEFADAVSRSTQTPEALAVMLMLSTIATCVQGKFEVSPFDGYTEPLQLWTLTALQSGSRKTTILQKVTAPLTMWETEKYAELELQIRETKKRRDYIQARCRILMNRAVRAEDPNIKEATFDEIEQLTKSMPPEINAPKLFTADVTPVGLQKLLGENNGRMSIIADEAGIFKGSTGISSSANVDVFLQGHAGSTIRVDRADRTLVINDPSISFGLTVQNDVITKLTRNGKDSLRDTGLLARFMFCIPESIIGTRDVRSTYEVTDTLKNQYHESVKSLLDIPYRTAEDGGKRVLELDKDALDQWYDFYQRIETDLGEAGSLHSISDWGGKLHGETLRIAGLMHVAEFGITKDTISLGTMRNAIAISTILIDHAKLAFDMIGTDPVVDDAKFVFKRIIENRENDFHRSGLHKQMHSKFLKVDRLKAALGVLAERSLISGPVPKYNGGRTEIIHFVNPSVWELIAA